MTKPVLVVTLCSLFALQACNEEDPPPAPPVVEPCIRRFEMSGDSQENAHLYADGQIVDRVDVQGDPETCPDGIAIQVEHRDTSTQLRTPSESCIPSTSTDGAPAIWFVQKLSCECGDPWDWFATDKAPPVRFAVKIRPVSSCDEG